VPFVVNSWDSFPGVRVKITIYQKPTCTTCRQVFAALKESGVEMESVNYYIEPLSRTKLKELVKKMGIKASELLRKKEEIYKELKLSEKELSDDEAIALMVKYPDLLQRPIVEKGAKAILARPAERLKEIL
jgi:arsenate reductase